MSKENVYTDANLQVERLIALKICKDYCIKTLRETDEFCLYREGVFVKGKESKSFLESYISQEIEGLYYYDSTAQKKMFKLTPSKLATILYFIKEMTYTFTREFDNEEAVINLKNCLYSTEGFEGLVKNPNFDATIPSDSDNSAWMAGITPIKHHETNLNPANPYLSFVQFPIKYEKDAECLAIDQFFTDVFGFETVPLVYEMIGYCLASHIKFQKAFILYGPPKSGKTTFLELIERFFGGFDKHAIGKNISQIPLQELGDKFELYNLKDKVINLFDDLHDYKKGRLSNATLFRIITTKNFISGAKKYAPERITWKNRIKLIFTCNLLPPVTKNVGDEFWRRWILLPCFMEFKNKDKMTQDDLNDPNVKERDYDMLRKISLPEELSGLFNKAMEAYMRLLERGHFPKKWDDIEKVRDLWQMDIEPAKSFVEECCDIGVDYEIEYYLFQQELNKFREAKGFKSISQTACTRSLGRISNHGVKRSSNRKNYSGIRFKPEIADDLELVEPKAEVGNLDNYLNDLEKESKERYESKEVIDYSDEDRLT